MKAPLLAGSVALMALISGCAGQPASVPPTQAASAAASQTAGAQETAPVSSATSEKAKPAVDEFSVSQLQAMPSDRFNSLSFEDKSPYLKHLLTDAQKQLMYYTAPGTNLYKYNPLDTAKETNTAQEVAMQLWYGLQLVHAQPKSDDINDHTLDRERALKALSVPFYSTESAITPTYSFLKNEINSELQAGIVKDRYADAKDVSPLKEEEDHKGNKIRVRTVSLLDNGVEHILKVTYRKLDESTSIWQIYSEVV